jgi:hypothetical protein
MSRSCQEPLSSEPMTTQHIGYTLNRTSHASSNVDKQLTAILGIVGDVRRHTASAKISVGKTVKYYPTSNITPLSIPIRATLVLGTAVELAVTVHYN